VTERKRKPAPRRRRRRFDPTWGQFAAVAAVLVAGGLFFLGGRGATGGDVKPTAAPAFTMPSTAGGSVSLSDLAGHNVLLYFNEGVGCDACFYQTIELEKAGAELAEKDVTLLPIVMNPVESVQGELGRFQITTPYLIDVDGSVSRAYGVLGKGMHADLPGHGFVFIDATGQIRWEKEYPSMYASASEVLGAVGRFVA
jgi:peroxiredoxin